ncbi:MAG TPA: fatty acid desaturase [Mesorhizobium sp.]|jgi:fatty acid desaturase|nr:fatty acid desaturase [Mesorhizobium sp.]
MDITAAVKDDHRRVIASLSPAERRKLTALSDGPGLLRLSVHGGLAAVLGVLIALQVPFWPLLLFPQGLLLAFLFTAEHECIHGTGFRSRRLNQSVAFAAGLFLLLPPNWFRYFHFAHHRHTQDPEHDPELMGPKPRTFREYALYLSGVPYWTSLAKSLWANALGRAEEPWVPPKGVDKVQAEARAYLGIYAALIAASLLAGTTALLWACLVPVLLGQPFLRAFVLAEHARCPMVADMLANTRTTLTNVFVRWLSWNMPFHAEHHAYPAVPFHQLPPFHAVIRDRLRVVEPGYARFHARFAGGLERQER